MLNCTIKSEYIADPPVKVALMYEAVSALVRENVAIDRLKVQDITSRAGIGKGTAYEYFASKEEIIAHALMYEYSCKIRELVDSVKAVNDFRSRIYRVMDWIYENREYNQMFTRLMQLLAVAGGSPLTGGDDPFAREATQFILTVVGEIMEDGFKEGVFTEKDPIKRAIVVLTQMSQYGCIVMSPYSQFGIKMSDEELREFVYSTTVKALN